MSVSEKYDACTMPVYESPKKQVKAAKIIGIYPCHVTPNQMSCHLEPIPSSTDRFPQISLSERFIEQHEPKVGGYLVRYPDGYLGFANELEFEARYSFIRLKAVS